MRNSHPIVQTDTYAITQFLADLNDRFDQFAHKYGAVSLRISIGFVFLWFGVLKFFPSVSPAEDIAVQTLHEITFGLLSARTTLIGLAIFESAIGVCFVTGIFPKIALPLLFAHMIGTGLPFLLFPSQLFDQTPFVPTFLGQYIVKNVVIVSAILVLRRRWR